MSEPPDCIIFDCDGVLVDVSESYYATIVKTAAYVLERLGVEGAPPLPPYTIPFFKDTGAFNNEVDLTYAAVLMVAASARAGAKDPRAPFAECAGIKDAERRARSLCQMDDVIGALAYPGSDSMVQEVFDQLFYGPELYHKVSGKESRFPGPGLIERERVLLDDVMREWLPKRFGSRIGMVTGRGYESARRTLGSDMRLFDVAGSAFLEDRPRRMAKPNPEALLAAMKGVGARRCAYVGDSAEDLMMARAAGSGVTFVGVWGTAHQPEARRRLFADRGADHTVRTIAGLPALLGRGGAPHAGG